MSFTFAGQWGPDSITGSGGAPLPNDTVTVYEADGVTLATIYTDRTMGSTTPNPTNADLYGNLSIFAVPGQYVISGNGGTLNITIPVDPEDVGTGSGSVPVGDESKVTTPITYNDPISGDSIEVLTFTEDTTAIALAITGDTYPEVVIRPDVSSGEPVMAFSDGTFDPLIGPNGEQNGFFWNPSTTYGLSFELNSGKLASSGQATDCQASFPVTVGNILNVIALAGNAFAQELYGTNGFLTFLTSDGDPNTENVPGNLNDVCFNAAATGSADFVWRCSVAGDAGAATWVEYSSGGGAVSSVFGRTGTVAATSGDYTVGQVTGAAPLASPSFTGTPVAPNQAALTSNFSIATTFYADAAVGVETTRAQAAEASTKAFAVAMATALG